MDQHHYTEEQFIVLLRTQNRQACNLLYDQHKNWVYHKALSIVTDSREAEELMQDVFLEVFASIDSYKGMCEIKGWIYRITVNKSINRYRYLHRKRRMQEVLFCDGQAPDHIRDTTADAASEQAAEQHYEMSDLLRVTAALKPMQQQAFVLCKLQRSSYDEAAQQMNCTVESVRGLLQRAKRNIRILAENRTSKSKRLMTSAA